MAHLRNDIFDYTSGRWIDPWEGETLALKVALIQATKNWKTLTREGLPYPIAFDPEDARETMKLNAEQRKADEYLEAFQNMIGCGEEGWVPAERYEEAMALSKEVKEAGLAATESEEERAQVLAHWPLDDTDEEEYM
ncbi:hypothetical protein F5887DRAFT_1275805 [Amanita rubescens]|nr:hypothetical protein F5887DRAFT_1275805 [Amanita rubescens]